MTSRARIRRWPVGSLAARSWPAEIHCRIVAQLTLKYLAAADGWIQLFFFTTGKTPPQPPHPTQ